MQEKERKNLEALYYFMCLINKNPSTFAELIGVSKQAVYKWFAKDDMKLSSFIEVFEKFRMEVSFIIVPPESNIVFEGFPYFEDTDASDKRLSFLKRAMTGHTYNEVANGIGCSEPTIEYWFRVDDCTISKTRAIATFLGYDLHIKVTSIDDGGPKNPFSFRVSYLAE